MWIILILVVAYLIQPILAFIVAVLFLSFFAWMIYKGRHNPSDPDV